MADNVPNVGQLLNNDVIQIKTSASTDTVNNYLASQESDVYIDKLDSEVVLFKAQDDNKDI